MCSSLLALYKIGIQTLKNTHTINKDTDEYIKRFSFNWILLSKYFLPIGLDYYSTAEKTHKIPATRLYIKLPVRPIHYQI